MGQRETAIVICPNGGLTQEQGLVRVSVDQAFDRRILSLVKRVQGELGVVGLHLGLGGNELAEDGVVQRILPVDSAQNIRPGSG